MQDQIEMHPHTSAQARADAKAFDCQGAAAMSAQEQKRADIVGDMQNELQKMTPEERKLFYTNYDDATASKGSLVYSNGAVGFSPDSLSHTAALKRIKMAHQQELCFTMQFCHTFGIK